MCGHLFLITVPFEVTAGLIQKPILDENLCDLFDGLYSGDDIFKKTTLESIEKFAESGLLDEETTIEYLPEIVDCFLSPVDLVKNSALKTINKLVEKNLIKKSDINDCLN